MLALSISSLTTSFVLASAAAAAFYIMVDSYFGCLIAAAVSFSPKEIRGLIIGIVVAFGYVGCIYQTFAFHTLASIYPQLAFDFPIFTCVNYLAALTCFGALYRCKSSSMRVLLALDG